MILKAEDIHTYYGDCYILQGVSLELGRGEVLGIIGRNAMGKTTLIRSIIGFTPPRAGRVFFKDKEITTTPPYQIVRAGVGIVPQGREIFPTLSVKENLTVGFKEKPGGWTLEKIYELFPPLRERMNHPGNRLSGGEQQMLAVGRAFMSGRKIMLLDEPSMGLAPLLMKNVFDSLKEINREGTTILIVEQNARMALQFAGRGYLLENGRVVLEGRSGELLADPRVKKAYLGG